MLIHAKSQRIPENRTRSEKKPVTKGHISCLYECPEQANLDRQTDECVPRPGVAGGDNSKGSHRPLGFL